jgi:hypothetical protein
MFGGTVTTGGPQFGIGVGPGQTALVPVQTPGVWQRDVAG